MSGIRSFRVAAVVALGALAGGCGLSDAFKTPEPWFIGIAVEGAPDALCQVTAGKATAEGRAPGNIQAPRYVPDPVPPKTKFDTPKYLPLVLTCAREGFVSAELTLRETREGWAITGIKYWPGHTPRASIARFQRSPTAFTVPMQPGR